MGPTSSLKVLFWNARGIINKLTEFKKYLYDNWIDVVCVCETFLKDDKDIRVNGYRCVFENRTSGRFGGLLIMIKEGIPFKPINIPATQLLECLGVSIDNANFILVYLPGQSSDGIINSHFINDIALLDRSFQNKFILGDMNARHKSWNCSDNNRAGILLNNYLNKSHLLMNAPADHTYCPVSVKMRPSTIDLLLSDSINSYSRPWVVNEFYSDHMPVRFNIKAKHFKGSPVKIPCYQLTNWRQFRDTLDNTLGPLELSRQDNSKTHIDLMIQHITDSIIKARDLATPFRMSNKDRIYIDRDLKDLISKRKYARQRFNRHHDPVDAKMCQDTQKLIKAKISELKNDNWSKKLKDCTTRNNNVYQLIKSRRSLAKGPSIDANNQKIYTDEQKANELANAFASAHVNPLASSNKIFTRKVVCRVKSYLDTIRLHNVPVIRYSSVKEIINLLKISKSPGIDGINNRMLKNLSPKAIEFITNIFNLCMSVGYFPKTWKTAIVVAIPKPGKDHKLATSYRPISLLCSLSKILEKIINNQLREFIDISRILPDEQFGFRMGHSTNHQLVRVYKHIDTNLYNKNSVGIIALDILKAFDSVWHDGLTYKLIQNDCPGHLTCIIDSFIRNRTFIVKFGGSKSREHSIPFGVPQGSVLSPSLYNIYISDIPKDKDCVLSLFADDTAISTSSRFFKTIKTRLTKYHAKIEKFFHKWKIKTNNSKTQAIFCTNRKSKQLPTEALTLNNCDIPWNNSIKYLGLHIDTKLNLVTHISETLTKADKAIRILYPLIHRTSDTHTKIKILIYKLYLRPILTYAGPILSLASRTQLKRLQVKENKILRMILDKPYDYSTELLHKESAITSLSEFIINTTTKFKIKSVLSDNLEIRKLYSPVPNV